MWGEKHSEWSKVDQGMIQGCILVRPNCEGGRGLQGRGEAGRKPYMCTCSHVLFVDDIVLLADSEESLHDNLKEIKKTLTK